MTKLEKDLAALETMPESDMRSRWQELHRTSAPNVPPSLLRPLLAQALQEKRHGSLLKLVRRELMRLAAEGKGGGGVPAPMPRLSPGARLVREWNEQTVQVDVIEDGFQYAGRRWNSLSEIARHVTGTHWSGPRFFGLVKRG
jgi:hypothetical protein